MRAMFFAILATTLSVTVNVGAKAEIGVLYPQVNLVSDFRYAGMSNSNGEPTVQGSLYLWRPDGFYAGTWVTGVDFGYDGSPTWEIDTYVGHKFSFGKSDLALEVMASVFPDQSGPGPTLNFIQTAAKLEQRIGRFSIREKISWSPEGSYAGGQTWQTVGYVTWKATGWLDLKTSYGAFLSQNARDRKFWEAGVAMKVWDVAFEVLYFDTDLDKAQCFHSTWCEPSVVGKVTWNVPLFGFKRN